LIGSPSNVKELFLFGGEYYNGALATFFNDLFIYHIEKDEWRLVTSPNSPLPRSGHAWCRGGNTGGIYLFGGMPNKADEDDNRSKVAWLICFCRRILVAQTGNILSLQRFLAIGAFVTGVDKTRSQGKEPTSEKWSSNDVLQGKSHR